MMIKAGQILSFDKELEDTRNQSLQELVKRQDIREFVEKNHLTKKALEDAWVDLLAYVDDHEPCLHCHGINECPKMISFFLAFITITCLPDLHLLA